MIHVERAGSWDDHRSTPQKSPIIEGPLTEFSPGDDAGSRRGKYYAAPYFNILHHGKLGISLNTRHPAGLALAKKLIGLCDALVENFSGRTRARSLRVRGGASARRLTLGAFT